MQAISKILHPTDFSSHADAALARALTLARRFRAELHVLHVTPSIGESTFHDLDEEDEAADPARRAIWEQVRGRMRSFIGGRAEGIRLKQICGCATLPAPAILTYARSAEVDLLVLATVGDDGTAAGQLGSTAAEVLHQAHVPVLTVGMSGGAAASPPGRFERMLVPVEVGDVAEGVLDYAADWAAFFEAHLDLLHVLDPSQHPSLERTEGPQHEDVEQALGQEARQHLEAYRARLLEKADASWGQEGAVGVHVAVGTPSEAIRAFAREHETDLIVLGSRKPHNGGLGSVAEQVVRRAPCVVLTVHPTYRSAPQTGTERAALRGSSSQEDAPTSVEAGG